MGRDTPCPPCGEVALTTVIPSGKAIEPAKSPAQRGGRETEREGQAWRMRTTQYLRSTATEFVHTVR